MFEYCSDLDSVTNLQWFTCYFTTPKHASLYFSFFTVVSLVLLVAPLALFFGFLGAFGARSKVTLFRWISFIYTSIVRGVPDIVFFLFVPLALDQGLEWLRHKVLCPEMTEPVRQGNDFVVCAAAKFPLNSGAVWTHDLYGFVLAVLAFAFVLGAFCANVLSGALKDIPNGQIEAGQVMGLSRRYITRFIEVPQMWIYALPGLSNLWQLLIKATPLLFLLGIEDIVYWARELGGAKTSVFMYSHADWRIWYFTGLMIFYLIVTYFSQKGFEKIQRKLSFGQNFSGNEQ